MSKTQLDVLQEQRESLMKEQQSIITKAETEAPEGMTERSLTDDEHKRFEEINRELETVAKDISKAESLREARRMQAVHKSFGPSESPEDNAGKQFRFTKIMKSLTDKNGKLEGLEAELHQEAQREANRSGQDISGIGIPGFMLDIQRQNKANRALVVGTAASAGNMVATDLGEMQAALQPTLVTEQLGINILTGLTSNFDMPVGDTIAEAIWEGETDNAAETTPTVAKRSFTGKRLATFTDLSKKLAIMSAGEAYVRSQLTRAVSNAGDKAVLQGNGAAGALAILGILNTAGVNTVALGTNGDVPSWNTFIDMETEVYSDNAEAERMGYALTMGLRGLAKKTAQNSNVAGYIMQGNEINGYQAVGTNHLPNDLTKGSGTDLHAMIFGNFGEGWLGQFGGLDLTVDSSSKAMAIAGLINVTVNSYWDFHVRHPKAFTVVKDATLA